MNTVHNYFGSYLYAYNLYTFSDTYNNFQEYETPFVHENKFTTYFKG